MRSLRWYRNSSVWVYHPWNSLYSLTEILGIQGSPVVGGDKASELFYMGPMWVRGTTNIPHHPLACSRSQTKWGDTFAVWCDPWRWRTGSWWLCVSLMMIWIINTYSVKACPYKEDEIAFYIKFISQLKYDEFRTNNLRMCKIIVIFVKWNYQDLISNIF